MKKLMTSLDKELKVTQDFALLKVESEEIAPSAIQAYYILTAV